MTGTLYIVATPIGNLKDITLRALEVIKEADVILAEDPRVTLKLLNHYGVEKKLIPYHEGASPAKKEKIIQELFSGRSYALVSDAGTPAVSDPGARLVSLAVENGVSVVPIPGVSAVTALLSVMGAKESAFHFWGFFPKKKKQQKILIDYFLTLPGPHVFFESPYRILKTLQECFLPRDEFHLVVGRELTKKFEEIIRGRPGDVMQKIKDSTVKGEFCVGVINKIP